MSNYLEDAGHGGTDPGASAKGNIEKAYTLEAALHVDKRLNEHGIASDLSRTADSTLDQGPRTDKAKKYKKCISHHFNAGGGSGVETIHSIYSDGKFEQMIIDEFKKAGYPVRPKAVYTRKGTNGKDYYYMHRASGACQTTIIEYEFVDGPQAEKIKDKKYRIGMYECVVKAICRREGVVYKPIVAPKPVIKPTASAVYRVQVGAFSVHDNAIALQKKLKEKGFDSIITEV